MQGRRAVEEERDRDLQDVGNLLQPAGTDPIGALLVFLDLLERQAERIPKLLLAHAEHHSAHSDPAPHMFVDGVGSLLGHNALLCGCGLP